MPISPGKHSAMTQPRYFIWTGGRPDDTTDVQERCDELPQLADPTPLRRAALIEYRWGSTNFDITATACSVRVTAWGDEQMTWLHCKAMTTASIKPEGQTGVMCVLIPAHYVTAIKPG